MKKETVFSVIHAVSILVVVCLLYGVGASERRRVYEAGVLAALDEHERIGIERELLGTNMPAINAYLTVCLRLNVVPRDSWCRSEK